MDVFTSPRERRLWALAAAVVVAIYATLGQVPAIAQALRDRNALDQTFFNAFVIVVAAVIVVGLSRRPSWAEIAVGIAVIGAYTTAFLRFANPAERTHLFEFGVVAVLVYLALLERQSNGVDMRSPAVVAVVAASTLGWIDEGIQAVLPNRFFDPIDLGFNTGAALMAVVSVAALRWARTRSSTNSPPDEGGGKVPPGEERGRG